MLLTRLFKYVFLGLLSTSLMFLFVASASAAVVTWQGGSGDNWSTGANWDTGNKPTSVDIATFDGTGNVNCIIDETIDVLGIDINTGYTQTIIQDNGSGITVGTGNFNQATGTFLGSIQAGDDIYINGQLVVAGSFTSTVGDLHLSGVVTVTGTFSHNGGTVIADNVVETTTTDFNNALTLNNFTVNKGPGYVINLSSQTITVLGTLILTDGTMNTGTIDMQGATTTVGSAIDGGTTVLKFSQGLAQTFTNNASYFNHSVEVDKSGGSFSFSSNWLTDDDVSDFLLTAGTVNLGSYNMTVDDFTVTAGTFNGGAGTIQAQDNFTVTAGTFNGSSGVIQVRDLFVNGGVFNAPDASGSLTIAGILTVAGTFTHNSGTVYSDNTFIAAAGDINSNVTFYNFVINKPGYAMTFSSQTLTVLGTLTLTDGIINTGTIDMQGATTTVGSGMDGGSAVLKFSQGLTQTFTNNASYFNHDIEVDKSGGSLGFASDWLTDDDIADFVLTAGTVNLGSYSLTVDDFTVTAGTFNGGSGTIQAQDNFTVTAGTFNGSSGVIKIHDLLINGGIFNAPDASGSLTLAAILTVAGTFNHNSGTVSFENIFAAAAGDINSNVTFYNFAINKPGYAINFSAQTVTVLGTLALTDSIINTGTIDMQGATTTVGSGMDGGNAIVRFSQGLAQTFDLTGATSLFNGDIEVDKSGGSVQLLSNLTMDASDQDLTITEGVFDLNGYDLDINDQATSDFDIEDGGTLRWEGTETLAVNAGDPTLASGSTVVYDPASGTATAPDWAYHHLIIEAGGSAVVQIGATESIGANLTISSGTFSLDGNDLTVVGTFSDLGTLRLRGDETVTLTNDTDSGTVEYVGNGDSNADDFILQDWTYNSLLVNLTDSNDRILTSGISVANINGDFSITGGSFNAPATLNVKGSFTGGSGFVHSSGTVVFTDNTQTSTVTGDTTFNNLSSTTASKAITFIAGSTQTVGGVLTLTGADGSLITLRSSSPSTAWNLNVSGSGTSSVDYVDVQDSDASSGNAIRHAVSVARSVDSDRNVDWGFNDVPTVATVTAVQTDTDDGDVLITFIIDDADDDDAVQAKIEYSLDGGSSWADPTISVTGSETSASVAGDPSVDNAQTYQVGQSGAYILTSSGANTISIVWESATDIASSTDIANAQIRVTPYDATVAGSAGSSSNFALDLVSPSSLATFVNTGADSSSATFTWVAASDTNFDHYEIWYGIILADVQGRTGAAIEWDNDDDANLTSAATATTTITVDPNGKYFEIWAVDAGGNLTTITEVLVVLGSSSAPVVYGPTGLTVEDYADGVVKVSWVDPTEGEANKISIYRGVQPYPVNGVAITYVYTGVEYYLDTDLEEGDVVTYQLKGVNGSTHSSFTDSVTFTLAVSDDSDEEDAEISEEEEEEETSGGGDDDESEDEAVDEDEEETSGGGDDDESEDEAVDEDEEETSGGDSLDDLGIETPDHWAEGYLKNLGEEDRIIEAAAETMSFFEMLVNMFEYPNVGMNRGEALELLLILADYDAVESAVNSFSDVNALHERGYLIEFAADNNLIEGYPDGTFGPDDVVNRAEALKMAAYFFGLDLEGNLFGADLLEEYALDANPFVDVNLEAWYAPYLMFAYSNGIVHGYDDGTHRFGPGNDVTYAEFLKIATLMADVNNAIELASELE